MSLNTRDTENEGYFFMRNQRLQALCMLQFNYNQAARLNTRLQSLVSRIFFKLEKLCI